MNNEIKLNFSYNGTPYSGYIISSTDQLPHYHWFFFDDEALVNLMSDCIPFKIVGGELKPVYHYVRHQELLTLVKQMVSDSIPLFQAT